MGRLVERGGFNGKEGGGRREAVCMLHRAPLVAYHTFVCASPGLHGFLYYFESDAPTEVGMGRRCQQRMTSAGSSRG